MYINKHAYCDLGLQDYAMSCVTGYQNMKQYHTQHMTMCAHAHRGAYTYNIEYNNIMSVILSYRMGVN